ncbi:hypothetical protein Tco_0547002, partial [Tanacetum coccineum]
MTIPIYVAKELLLDRQKTQANNAEAIQKECENLHAEVISQ